MDTAIDRAWVTESQAPSEADYDPWTGMTENPNESESYQWEGDGNDWKDWEDGGHWMWQGDGYR